MITRALRHRNYRLFFTGQSVSLIGTWLTRTATSWLVFRLTHSPLMLGLISFASLVPMFLLTPIAGVLVDRWDRKRVLLITQICAAVQSAMLAVLTLSGSATVPWLLGLNVFQGLINSFDFPTRHTLVVQMVEDRNDLPNAIALNSSMVNMARLVGPSLAGILIAVVGEGGCFTIDAVSYLAVIATVAMMKIKQIDGLRPARKPVLRELGEGLKYAASSRQIVSVLLLFALVSFMGVPYLTLLPVVVSERLLGGAKALGFLTSASGCGALVGVLFLSSRKTSAGLEKIVFQAALCFGTGLILFAFARGFTFSVLTMFIAGLGMMVQASASNTVLQTVVIEDKRARVMSLYATAYTGMAPCGSLVGGALASRFGAATMLGWGGVVCCLAAVLFYTTLPASLRMRSRPEPNPA